MRRAVFPLFLALLLSVATAGAQEDANFSDELWSVDLEPDEALILITIVDKAGTPMEGVVMSIQQGFHKKPFNQVSDKEGKVWLILPVRNTYNITFLSLGGSTDGHAERFDIDGESEQRYSLDMVYDATSNKEFVLEGVNFKSGTAVLQKSSFKKLDPLVEYMKLKPEIYIELAGHTDNVGTPEENLTLSEQRAKAVKEYLVKQGIKASRIAHTGFGDMKPLASNDTEKGRKLNRRTEVKVID